jgi:hypothetical protein
LLRDVVGTFLDTLSEREFIHGPFEFGKDVIARKTDPTTGITHQYSIQSKAGDLNQASWREVRPQLEEAEYNTQAHPSFDANLPRIAVLVTTGRLKGAAAVDASEFKKAMGSRGLADLEIWERPDLIEWICNDPLIGLAGGEIQLELMSIVTRVRNRTVTEPELERYTRCWLSVSGRSIPASIESAILVNLLRQTHRLDLAAMTALQLLRAVQSDPKVAASITASARRMFTGLAMELLTQVEPLLDDPLDIARATFDPMGLITYPVICCRVAEIIALLAITSAETGHADVEARAGKALGKLASLPGTSRPPSDAFAASIVAVVVALRRYDESASVTLLHAVSKWLLDRHDPDMGRLGLASLDEDEERTCARLLGGSLSSTDIPPRSSSYLAVVVLDLCLFLGPQDLYEGVRANVAALRVVPEATRANESLAHWRRGGPEVWPQPRVDFDEWHQQLAVPVPNAQGVTAADSLLLASACRSRHYRSAWTKVDGTTAP